MLMSPSKPNIRANKAKTDWVVAMYSDHGKKGQKLLVRTSFSVESAEKTWLKLFKAFSRNGSRCWQEDKRGNLIRESS